MIHTNPEPFIQQVLKAENGWPVPKHYGSCGRVTVSENCGEMLTNCVKDDWDSRKHLALQLLDSALNFTFNHPHFAFYFTDITPDNIAVTTSGEVKFIDLDNVIIVERSTTADLPAWTVPHSSEDIECDNCFAFSSDAICSHHYSDHNVYAVCREILNQKSHLIDGGLLHSTPPEFLEKHPDFIDSLEQCVSPRTSDRFHHAKKLMKILS
ncbi:divergent protein kinase domain 2A isoform X2 [Nilaparvata lugens]|nr:divergent protein kinase domain 2A isoform X2 [Nilaparvata lugens]